MKSIKIKLKNSRMKMLKSIQNKNKTCKIHRYTTTRILFKQRSRMINVRNNYENKYEDLMCP